MTGLSYEALDAMTFIEAANQFDVAAADASTILKSYGVEEQAYFSAYTDDVRALISSLLSMATRLCICEPCHVCEYKSTTGTCGYIERDGLDLSDGSDLIVDQPLLEPTDWFLTEQEITDSRGGSPRDDLAVYSSGNDVTTFTATNEFFDAAFEDLSATGEGDRVMLAAWSTDLVPFQPNVDDGNSSGFHEVFAGVVERGGSFNALVWSNLLEAAQNVAVRDDVTAIPASSLNGAKAVYVFDDRVRTTTSSHHQKNLIIASASSTGSDDHPVAFVGVICWYTVYPQNKPR
ncbi:hypothetical protein BBJ28_00027018, partial [Nothophytophthora sp. Chile5]